MKFSIDPAGIWYHGSNVQFDVLREGSTVTQWRQLAEAFSHKPAALGYDDDGTILHNGMYDGVLYVIDEPVAVGTDVVPHPSTVMDENVEWLTSRPLRVRRIALLPVGKRI